VVEVVTACVFVPLLVVASVTGDRTVGNVALVVVAAGVIASRVIRRAGNPYGRLCQMGSGVRLLEVTSVVLFAALLITGWATHDGTVVIAALAVGAFCNTVSYVLRREHS
jgi:hypothetical protein